MGERKQKINKIWFYCILLSCIPVEWTLCASDCSVFWRNLDDETKADECYESDDSEKGV